MSRKLASLFLTVFPVLPLTLAVADPLFFSTVKYSSGGIAQSPIGVGDLNGDGKPDVVVINGPGTLGLLFGNGDGTFRPVQNYPIASNCGITSFAIADVNRDGKADLVVAENCSPNSPLPNSAVAILLGNGDGTFQAPVTYSSGGVEANTVALADLNGDGNPDIMTANECGVSTTQCVSNVGVLLGNGDGTFQSPQTYFSGGADPVSIGVADVNLDGKLDLVVANYHSDASGLPDSGFMGILLGNGDGTFQDTRSFPSGGGNAWSVALADLNGDGNPDIVIVNENTCVAANCGNPVAVFLGNGDGTFQIAQTYNSGGLNPTAIAVADMNGDGIPDLLVANQEDAYGDTPSVVGVLIGNGDGAFQTPQAYQSGGRFANSIAVADVNGDGRPDVLVSNFYRSISYQYRNTGSVGVLLKRHLNTTTTVSTSGSPVFTGQPITFTARVTSANGMIPNGETVTFYADAIPIGTSIMTNGVATLTASPLRAGIHPIRATYSGDLTFRSSYGNVREIVERYPSTTSLSSAPNPSVSGQVVQLTAMVTSSAPTITMGTVTFMNGTSVIGTATLKNGIAIHNTTALPAGTLSVTAVYDGNPQTAPSKSAPVTQIVN